MSIIDTLRTFIEHAPDSTPRPEGQRVIGLRGEGFTICDRCHDRIRRRGCTIPIPTYLLWIDRDEAPDCDLKEYHS